MTKLFPGILFAIVAGVPGFWIGSLIAAPRFRERPPLEIAETLIRAIPVYFYTFGIPALVYGSVVWLLLRAIGSLSLFTLVVAATIPVFAYFVYGIFLGGWDARLLLGLMAFWLPALFIAIALWWFTIHAIRPT